MRIIYIYIYIYILGCWVSVVLSETTMQHPENRSVSTYILVESGKYAKINGLNFKKNPIKCFSIVFGCMYDKQQHIKDLGVPQYRKVFNFKTVPKVKPKHLNDRR